MRRVLGAATALALMAAMAGCGSGGTEAAPAGQADEKITMGFAQVGAESGWRTANTKSVQESAKEAGVTLKFSDAQQKQENQIKAIRGFIAQGVDAILVAPVLATGWDDVLAEAKEAEIPVVLLDRGRAAGIVAGVLVVMYLFNVVAALAPDVDWFASLSAFHYFNVQSLIGSGAYPIADSLLLGAIAVSGWAVAIIAFRRRDLAA